MRRARLLLPSLLLIAATSVAASPLPSAAGEERAALEHKLLRADLAAYRDARAAEDEAANALSVARSRLDAVLAEPRPTLEAVAPMATAVADATVAARIAAERSERARERVIERLRVLAALDADAEAGAPAAAEGRSLAGRWRVEVGPDRLAGTFNLQHSGAVVTGTYTLTDGSGGSLRGTVAGRHVHLERVDRTGGFDAIFDGTVSAGADVIEGEWVPTILSEGGPGGGRWTAHKQSPSPQEEP